jgi:hypothetical protein
MHSKWFLRLSILILTGILFISALGPVSAQTNAFNKVLVQSNDPVGLNAIKNAGGVMLADYGSFSLWRVPENQAQTLRNNARLNLPGEMDQIELRGGSIDTRPGAAQPVVPNALQQKRSEAEQFWMVQFVGPVKDEWLAGLEKLGLKRVIYMPNNAYVVWGSGAVLAELDQFTVLNPFVQWSGPYQPAYRLEPSLQKAATLPSGAETVKVTVQFYTTPDVDQSIARLLALSSQAITAPWQVAGFTNVSLELPVIQLTAVAGWNDVFNVEPYAVPTKLDEGQGQILAGNITTSGGNVVPAGPGYLAWLASKGFPTTPTSYPIVAVVDDGIDNGSVTPLHADFYELGSKTNPDRLIFNTNCTADASGDGLAGHGNLNAGIVAGYNNTTGSPYQDANGYQYGLGISPYGRVAGVKIFNNAGNFVISACGGTDNGVVAAAYNNGARITNNSWGATSNFGAYTTESLAYDALTRDALSGTAGNQEMLHVFSAGNTGETGAKTIGSPGTAKNVLTVGATENVRDEGVADGCGISAANNADDIATFSSRGPTNDSRTKPDIMAPGTHVQGPASQVTGYNGSGVCGMPTSSYYPAGQTLYTWSSGTSHSAPAVSGAASLLWEYYGRVLNPGQTPSPAMLKALLVNTPRYLNGSGTGGTLPSNNQGWGDVDLGTLTDGSDHMFVDQTQILSATGATYQTEGRVASNSLPFHVSLVWTDAPGSTTGNAYVNNLDLEVTVDGNTYKGNVFSGANSIPGGTADARNNVENVFIPTGVSGKFTVRVIAANISGDGVPGNADSTDQDFALVIYNGELIPDYALAVTPATQAVCAPTDAVFNVTIGSLAGYTDAVTLGVSGNPASTTTNFSTNPVTPPGSSLLTIGNTTAVPAGSYPITVTSTSTAGPQSDTATLNLYTTFPGAPLPGTPANNATGQATTPTFTWSAGTQSNTYDLDIATDAGFTNIVHSVSGLSGTSYSGASLNSATVYYWRVRASNGCGGGSYSSVFRFTTIALASGCAVGTTPYTLYNTDFESGASGWTHSGTGDTWTLSTTHPYGGTQAWHASDPMTVSDQRLVSPSVVLPSGQNPLLLKFWHTPYIEQRSATACYDGGILEVSSNGGTTWSQVLNADLISDPYIGLISTSYSNPLGGLNAWCKTSYAYSNAIANISSYAGQTVQFRFRLGSDSSTSEPGWDLDNVSVQSCLAMAAEVYADPSDATCGGNSPCYSGSGAIQSALNSTASGGVVHVLNNHTANASLTCAGNVTLSGASGATVTWNGAAGSLFTANNCAMTVKGLSLDGGSTASAFTAIGTGTLTAYANNLTHFTGAYTGSGTPSIGHNYWGTQVYSAPAPAGMPAAEWLKRMGAPVSSYAEGSGGASLGSATLTGGTGIAVIVNFGRGTANAPFTNGVAGHVDAMCSAFYDYFTLGGSGSWTLHLPVDATPAGCVDNTLNQNRMLRITDIAQCAPTDSACWHAVPAVTHTGSDLALAGLTAADLDGTHFVANDTGGGTPTAIGVSLFGRNIETSNLWLGLVLAAGGFALGWGSLKKPMSQKKG